MIKYPRCAIDVMRLLQKHVNADIMIAYLISRKGNPMKFGRQMRLFTEQQVKKVHTRSLDMLEKIGINIDSKSARDIFQSRGCEIKDRRVHIPGTLMEELLAHRQDDIVFHSRTGKALNVSKDGPFMHNGGICADIMNIRDGLTRRATTQDAADLVRLGDRLENLDMLITPVYPSDVPDNLSIMLSAKLAFENTDKPIVGAGLRNLAEGEILYQMCCALAGGEDALRSKPMIYMGSCPHSPLSIIEDDCDMIMFAAEKGLPVDANAAPIAGLTAPVTLLGSLTQQNAECLAVAALARLIDPTAKIMYLPRLTSANLMKMSVYTGTPHNAIMSACAAQLAAYYGFVSDVYGLATSVALDGAQMGLEKAIIAMYPVMAGAQILSGFGTVADCSALSYEMMLFDNEIFGMIKHLLGTIEDDEDDLGFEAVLNVVGGSSFIEEDNTFEYMKSQEIWNYKDSICVNTAYPSWINTDKKTMLDNAEEKVREILKTHTPHPLPDDQRKELDAIYKHWETRCN